MTVLTPRELAGFRGPAAGYVIIGAGKTAMDTCCWLLDRACAPADITWVRPRDAVV